MKNSIGSKKFAEIYIFIKFKFQEVILYYLEFFAIDDAILLAELYNDTG